MAKSTAKPCLPHLPGDQQISVLFYMTWLIQVFLRKLTQASSSFLSAIVEKRAMMIKNSWILSYIKFFLCFRASKVTVNRRFLKKKASEHIKSDNEHANSPIFVKMFRDTPKIHGNFFSVHWHFLGFNGKFFYSSPVKPNVHGQIHKKFTGSSPTFTGKKTKR